MPTPNPHYTQFTPTPHLLSCHYAHIHSPLLPNAVSTEQLLHLIQPMCELSCAWEHMGDA